MVKTTFSSTMAGAGRVAQPLSMATSARKRQAEWAQTTGSHIDQRKDSASSGRERLANGFADRGQRSKRGVF